MGGGTVVCVTGGSGYLGSWLVRKLLGRGCVVHATLRSLGILFLLSTPRRRTSENPFAHAYRLTIDLHGPASFR
jgi:nucleoside-diphosphate-sugar epimerase